MSFQIFTAIVIFAVTYWAMMTERIPKSIAALMGGCAMIIAHNVSEHDALKSIDMSVILLLASMMIMVHYLAKSGFFEYVAIRLAQIARGRPVPLLLILCTGTAVLSALLDNVTTVLLMAPVILLITDQLEIKPLPFLVFCTLASNIGGTATLIGDPPNILVGSASGLSFIQFIIHLTPIAIICMIVFLGMVLFASRKQAHVSADIRAKVMEMHASRAIRDKKLLIKSLGVLGLVLVMLLFHEMLGLHPATVALTGACLFMVISKADPEDAFRAVEWPTLFFFIGLFMLVSGLVETGILSELAVWAAGVTGNNLFLTAMVVLWFSAIASAFMGNVPVVTALLPVVKGIIEHMEPTSGLPDGVVFQTLWWSLALGACFGGNGTVFGAAANVVIIDIAKANRRPITFGQFMAYGLPVTLMTLVLSSLYVGFRYAF